MAEDFTEFNEDQEVIDDMQTPMVNNKKRKLNSGEDDLQPTAKRQRTSLSTNNSSESNSISIADFMPKRGIHCYIE